MMKQNRLCLLFLLLILGFATCQASDKKKVSVDGPYVMYNEAGQMRVIRMDQKGRLLDSVYPKIPKNYMLDVFSNNGKRHFQVKLHPFSRPAWENGAREKTLVISDPHGDLESFIAVLQNNGVIDKNYNWIFGKNQLVVIGDVFDRGEDVLPIYWLMYKLEQEALEAGGIMTFLLGNHEEMVLRNNLKYTRSKYKNLAEKLNIEYPGLWNGESELGRWLQTRNLMQVIGKDLYVHAGLSPEFSRMNYSIPAVNEEVGKSILLDQAGRKALSEMSDSIYSTYGGPFWYRGMVKNEDRYHPVYMDEVDQILKQYQVDRIFVGHTIFDNVTSFYGKKVVAVNVDNKKNREKGRTRGMMIQNGQLYWVYDKGEPQKYPY